MKKLKSFILSACLLIVGFTLVACGSAEINLATEGGILAVKPGDSVQLIATSEEDLTSVVYAFAEGGGSNLATISQGGLLTVKTDATPGLSITVVAKLGDIKSNELTITVAEILLTKIDVGSDKTTILPGGFATLSRTLSPTNTTQASLVEWQITEGSTYAEITGNKIFVSETAASGSQIKVKAVGGSISSDVLTFTVGTPSSEKLTISMRDTITAYSRGTNVVLEVEVFNGEFENISGQNVAFEIESGDGFLTISNTGYNCTLLVKGHGTAVVRATLDNGISKTCTVTCNKAPDAIIVPEVFISNGRRTIDYTVGKSTAAFINALPYAVNIMGEGACQTVKYSFQKIEGGVPVNETTPGEFGVYESGTIKFNSIGKIRVTATSTSGDRGEESASYDFTVNEGYNASTWEDLKTFLQTPVNINTPVNIIVTTKPVVTSGRPGDMVEYGYEIVPSHILDGSQYDDTDITDPTKGRMAVINTNIYVPNVTNFQLNGNLHNINLSKLRYFTSEDETYFNTIGREDLINRFVSLLRVNGLEVADLGDPTTSNAAYVKQAYYVTIKNLSIEGNVPLDGAVGMTYDGKALPKGVHARAIELGRTCEDTTKYLQHNQPGYIVMDNIYISNFSVGMRVAHAVNSTISNITVDDCFSNGIETAASQITFVNPTFGSNGAAGIEVTPDMFGSAGANFNEKQKISFAGVIKADFKNDGDTEYFSSLKPLDPLSSITVPQLTQASLGASGASDEMLSHIITAQNEMVFICLAFNEVKSDMSIVPNESILDYSEADENGIISFEEIISNNVIDTTHQFIKYTIKINLGSLLGMGDMNVTLGTMLLYNHHYAPAA